ncbi:MAG: histidinol phosphate phosphatase domain-containing protein [Armatimonadota bacterium]|nr:MAG: histidinol phosphate phosphatase domain-containing protein [Armatimonadota bacterium]
MLFDFHTHTIHSDGSLLPIELIRRAIARGHQGIAITDHASPANLASVLEKVIADCQLAEDHWEVRAIPGVELTHLPPAAISGAAAEARRVGAEVIVVHGETPVEPVPAGTNLAALRCSEVDILAHPGPLDVELGGLAARNGIFLELSARRGHSLANGAVAAAAREAGALLLVNSDAHDPDEILIEDFARKVAAGAGLSEEEVEAALVANPQRLLEKIARRQDPRGTAA